MKRIETANLKIGDLVVINSTTKHYKGLILEIESINPNNEYVPKVTLKQPGYDGGFRICNYNSMFLKKYEP